MNSISPDVNHYATGNNDNYTESVLLKVRKIVNQMSKEVSSMLH